MNNKLSLLSRRTRTKVIKINILVGTEFSGCTQYNIFKLRCCQQSYIPVKLLFVFAKLYIFHAESTAKLHKK